MRTETLGIHTMKLNRLSFLSICFGALVLQACSHAPRPQEASWAEPVSGEISLHRSEHAVLAGEWEYEESGIIKGRISPKKIGPRSMDCVWKPGGLLIRYSGNQKN